jgi:hypothetical protein
VIDISNFTRVVRFKLKDSLFPFNYEDFFLDNLPTSASLFNNTTLLMVNCVNPHTGLKLLEFYAKYLNFKEVLLFTHEELLSKDVKIVKIAHLRSWTAYNNFVLTLNSFVNSPFSLLVQTDGVILNPSKFTSDFFSYDYLGAPWPNDQKWINAQTCAYQSFLSKNKFYNRIGNGGFSLRSKKFLEYSSQFTSTDNLGEDFFLNVLNYEKALDFRVSYPSVDIGLKFAVENPVSELGMKWGLNYEINPKNHFGTHGMQFMNSKYFNQNLKLSSYTS